MIFKKAIVLLTLVTYAPLSKAEISTESVNEILDAPVNLLRGEKRSNFLGPGELFKPRSNITAGLRGADFNEVALNDQGSRDLVTILRCDITGIASFPPFRMCPRTLGLFTFDAIIDLIPQAVKDFFPADTFLGGGICLNFYEFFKRAAAEYVFQLFFSDIPTDEPPLSEIKPTLIKSFALIIDTLVQAAGSVNGYDPTTLGNVVRKST